MPTTADKLTTAARDILLAHPGLGPSRAYQLALERDPDLAAAHHAGEAGEHQVAQQQHQAQPAMVDPGYLLQLHAEQAGYSFAEAARDHPRLAEAWHRAELVQAPQALPASPPRPSVVRFRAPLPADAASADGTIRNVPVFRVGTHNGKSYSRAALAAMVTAFSEVGYRPPITLGHTDDPAALAHGYVSALRLDGDTLLADFADVPAETLALIREGRLLTLSCEIFIDLARNGQKFPYALRSIAMLGAHPPGVSGLPPLATALAE